MVTDSEMLRHSVLLCAKAVGWNPAKASANPQRGWEYEERDEKRI